MRLVSVGEVTLDHYLNLQRTFIGGISLNFAIHAKRSGDQHVSLVSRVGSEDGQQVLDKLEQENIDASHVTLLRGKTAAIDIRVLDSGDRVFPAGGYRDNVLSNFQLSEAELAFVNKQDVWVTLFDSRQGSHFAQLKGLEFSGQRVVDFGDWARRKSDLPSFLSNLQAIDLAFISGTQETVEVLRPHSRDDRIIVVTLGAEGSVALAKGNSHYQKAQKVSEVVDTTGCGDAFQAAFTIHYLKAGLIAEALQAASVRAASVLKTYGAS